MLEARKMDKHKDLSDFDKYKIMMATCLWQSISKTAGLVGCPLYAVVKSGARKDIQ